MVEKSSSVINSCCENHTERVAAYRLINNPRLVMDDIVSSLSSACSAGCEGLSHVLCVQDTTEMVFSHEGRLSLDDKDFGYGTNEHGKFCIFAHPGMVLDASSRMPVGLGHVKIWSRERSEKRSKKQRRGKVRLEQKESYRWLETARNTVASLPCGVRVTMVGDRENDVYSVMCRTLECGCDFLVRSMHDRPVDCDLDGGRMGIRAFMQHQPVAYEYDLELRGHKGRKARTARMQLRFAEVTIRKNEKCLDDVPDGLACYCVYAVEDASTVPDGEQPVEWRLLTSHVVETVGQAVECVEWYKCRWFIEEFFRVCKSEGFRIESVQLESGAAVKKLIVLTLWAALRCVALKRAYDEQDEAVPASRMFDDDEQELLGLEMERLHSRSPKALDGRNPFRENSLPWAVWIIARMGGWSGYVSAHGKPGYITIKQGLDRFHWHLEIITFAKARDVYKE